ncbi:TPA: carboxypeptidase-like regulatory domain-containing protein [Raoultella planticola]|uniref:hypothetical protein n=1 Tax=Raoultella planticola TaxID=575 RepID=UPI001A2666FF|nr:carboxypeptidase-like regulatory domain-containing protein [Raoultella planticola]
MSNSVDAIYSVANDIKTPLSLAALFVLILSGALRRILTQAEKPPLNPKVMLSLIRYLFGTAIIFGVIAMAGFFVPKENPNIIISGTLVDAKTHEPIPYTTVSITGLIGSGGRNSDTDENGNFNFTISRSTMSDDVKINISDGDYQYVSQSIVPTKDSALTIELSKASLEKNIFKNVDFYISHWTGIPVVKASVQLYNQNDGTIRVMGLSNIILTKVSDGIKTTIDINLFGMAPMKKIYLHSGKNVKLFGFFFTQPTGAGGLASEVFEASKKSTEFSDQLTDKLKKFAESNFFWTAGQWTIELTVDCEDQSRVYTKSFTLTDAQINAFKRIMNNYKTGYGITNSSVFYDDSLYIKI